MRLLVVEDEADLADAVAKGLRAEGYAVDVAYDGVRGPRQGRAQRLRPGLPRRHHAGHRRARGLPAPAAPDRTRPSPAPRVVLLTARDGVDDRVAGLDDGADDYLVKPFAFPELSARVRAVLRRDPAVDARGAALAVADLQPRHAPGTATRGGDRSST